MVTKWIAGGVGLYIAFALMAPRLHSLSKRRGYFTLSQFIYDRYMPPSGSSVYVSSIHSGTSLRGSVMPWKVDGSAFIFCSAFIFGRSLSRLKVMPAASDLNP